MNGGLISKSNHTNEAHPRKYPTHYLVADNNVRIDGGPSPAHDRDEHGEGGEDEVHVEDQRDEEGGQVDQEPG